MTMQRSPSGQTEKESSDPVGLHDPADSEVTMAQTRKRKLTFGASSIAYITYDVELTGLSISPAKRIAPAHEGVAMGGRRSKAIRGNMRRKNQRARLKSGPCAGFWTVSKTSAGCKRERGMSKPRQPTAISGYMHVPCVESHFQGQTHCDGI
jgi:hypothetical protein